MGPWLLARHSRYVGSTSSRLASGAYCHESMPWLSSSSPTHLSVVDIGVVEATMRLMPPLSRQAASSSTAILPAQGLPASPPATVPGIALPTRKPPGCQPAQRISVVASRVKSQGSKPRHVMSSSRPMATSELSRAQPRRKKRLLEVLHKLETILDYKFKNSEFAYAALAIRPPNYQGKLTPKEYCARLAIIGDKLLPVFAAMRWFESGMPRGQTPFIPHHYLG